MEELFVPGRTELIGNHTDHQGGRVVAATLHRGMRLKFRSRSDASIVLKSAGFDRPLVWPPKGTPHPSELMLGESLACGGRGWEGELVSELPSGGGLSSSAAFCVLLLRVQEALGGPSLTSVQRAILAREIEIKALGKPCGLMDQLVISAGGTVLLDFKADPVVESLGPPPFQPGWSLLLVETGVSHEDLTEDYAAIPREMKQAAQCFGAQRLVDVSPEDLLGPAGSSLPSRVLQRALHFLTEQKRVGLFRDAWVSGRWRECLELVNQSGESSALWLKNLVPHTGNGQVEDLFALLRARRLLRGYPGAERIHGGGFGGYIQLYLPTDEKLHLEEWLAVRALQAFEVWRT